MSSNHPYGYTMTASVSRAQNPNSSVNILPSRSPQILPGDSLQLTQIDQLTTSNRSCAVRTGPRSGASHRT